MVVVVTWPNGKPRTFEGVSAIDVDVDQGALTVSFILDGGSPLKFGNARRVEVVKDASAGARL